jgi:hypothetical protein
LLSFWGLSLDHNGRSVNLLVRNAGLGGCLDPPTGWKIRHHEEMETFLSLALLAAILVVCWLLTNWFANAMYRRCAQCGTLNARRRTECRQCGAEFS